MKTYFSIHLYCVISAVLYSCANPAPPIGGKKDLKKPVLTKTIPKNGSTQYNGKVIVFAFSEWIDENKLMEQIIITPKVDGFKHSVDKNLFTITLDTALQANTTYYFNLREGIKDLTEGNKADSVTLVFSTGKLLDSLFLTGEVLLTLENKKEKNLSVALYPITDTFRIETARPYYVTKTNDAGEYAFSYLKAGNYYLYAFKDDNNSNKYEKNKEYIAYAPQPIQLTTSTSAQKLMLVKEDHEKPKIKKVESNKKKITKINYNKPINTLNIRNLNVYNMNILYTFKQDEVSIFTNSVIKDTVNLILEASDVMGNASIDTAKIVPQYVDTSRTTVYALPGAGAEIEPSQSIEITLSKPYKTFSNQILLTTGGRKYVGNEILKIANIEELQNIATVKITPLRLWTDTVSIVCFPASFDVVSGYLKDTLKTKYTMKSSEKLGSIGGKVETESNNILVQLISKDDKLVKETTNKEFLFDYLIDGEYKIRVVDDLNKNSHWDQGDYRTKQLPEPIHHYPDPIKLKSNWEILDVKIAF